MASAVMGALRTLRRAQRHEWTFFTSSWAHFTASSAGMPCTALAYISVMMYLDTTSAALRPEGAGQPGAREVRITSRNGAMTGSSFHTGCFDHSRAAGIEKPFCDTNHRSNTLRELIQRNRSFAAFWFFE